MTTSYESRFPTVVLCYAPTDGALAEALRDQIARAVRAIADTREGGPIGPARWPGDGVLAFSNMMPGNNVKSDFEDATAHAVVAVVLLSADILAQKTGDWLDIVLAAKNRRSNTPAPLNVLLVRGREVFIDDDRLRDFRPFPEKARWPRQPPPGRWTRCAKRSPSRSGAW